MGTLSKNSRNIKGFTLIELIVVVAIISVLFVALVAIFNPTAQIEKTKNATRQQDFNQIRTALDTYINDKNCYPTAIPFGSAWSVGGTVYMQKVPEDPDCSGAKPSNCYVYETDGSSCPQWNILFSQMHQPIANTSQCVISSTCMPSGGIGSYNYCIVSGKMDCSFIASNPLPSPTVPAGYGGSGGTGGSGGGTPTPTPTPGQVNCSGNILSACSNGVCNVESASQCLQCGGSLPCYNDLICGGVKC